MGDDKKSFEAIQAEIAEAAEVIKIGSTYQHYKSPDMTYEVINFATREVDNELQVVYQALYGPGLLFTRPAKEWVDQVNWERQTVPRFRLVS
jgi:hypothetical protein